MPLEEYKRKRDFTVTPEPAGEAVTSQPDELRYVIHKHASRRLHYDLRLEVNGVYASWAVPKGLSLDTHDKHLAVHVEDHPIEYGEFEGVIPEGEYGAGTVMIWDRGAFKPFEDPAEGVEKGALKFALDGVKLHAAFALVRMKPRPGEKQESWLLIKERDEAVRPRDEYDILEKEPDSAATGRTMDEIKASGNVWNSNHQAAAAADEDPQVASIKAAAAEAIERDKSGETAAPAPAPASLPTPKDPPDPFPAEAQFELATLVKAAPEGDEWVHEVKYDGYRLRVAVRDGTARVYTRNHLDWTEKFAEIARAAEALGVESLILEGEAVVLDDNGVSDFSLLQGALSSRGKTPIRLETFDLLYLDGRDLRSETLLRRKELLASLLAERQDATLHYVDHVAGHGPEFYDASCALKLEGSVSKRADRPWVGGRVKDWLKIKCPNRQEFVIGGWTDAGGSREGFGSLLLGVMEGPDLKYAGKVGTGFGTHILADVRGRLDKIATDTPPFADPPKARNVHWVKPELVAEVVFREWTRDGQLRQASFKGLREDKDPATVVRETAQPTEQANRDGNDENPEPASRPKEVPTVGTKRSVEPEVATSKKPLQVAGVTITNPTRVLQPAEISKLELARYYEAVGEWMLPHVSHRLLTLVRCPSGTDGASSCFYQKHPENRGWSDQFKTVEVQDKSTVETYFYVDNVPGIVALAQMGTLEVHTWGSQALDYERPNRITFDLDPGPGIEFSDVVEIARIVRDTLIDLKLAPFVKTTGGHGLHVVTPIEPEADWEEIRAFSKGVVDILVEQYPDRLIGRMAKAEREKKVFLDYLRNAHGATAVCAFSTRARPGRTVSVPVDWDELGGLDPARFTIDSVPKRLARLKHDPWADYWKARPRLPVRV